MDRLQTRKIDGFKGTAAFEKFIFVDGSFVGLIIGAGGS